MEGLTINSTKVNVSLRTEDIIITADLYTSPVRKVENGYILASDNTHLLSFCSQTPGFAYNFHQELTGAQRMEIILAVEKFIEGAYAKIESPVPEAEAPAE